MIETDRDYQKRELRTFYSHQAKLENRYFNSTSEFNVQLQNSFPLITTLEWVENGSYGAGACFALQAVLNGLNNRTNNIARVGQFMLSVLYGANFNYWRRLTSDVQDEATKAVKQWLKQEHNFAQRISAG